jgi:hypothetical protein
MQDPIKRIKADLRNQPFEDPDHQRIVQTRIAELEEARKLAVASDVVEVYEKQRETAWALFEQKQLMPRYSCEDPETLRYVETLHYLLADAELIQRGFKAFSLQRNLMGDIGRVFHEADIKMADGSTMDGDRAIDQLQGWLQELDGFKACIQESHDVGRRKH